MKRLLLLIVNLALLGASLAAMQPGQGEFVPVNPQNAQGIEHIPAAPLVIAAYAFVWVALLVYVWSVWRRLTRVQREMDALARRIGDGSRAR